MGTPKRGEAAPSPQCCLGLRGRIHRRSAEPHEGDGFFPVLAVAPKGRCRGQLSRGVRQRLARRLSIDDHVFETVQAVNSMAGFDTRGRASDVDVSPVALAALQRMRRLHAANSPADVREGAQEACSALLGGDVSPYLAGEAATPVRPYARQSVA